MSNERVCALKINSSVNCNDAINGKNGSHIQIKVSTLPEGKISGSGGEMGGANGEKVHREI